MFCLQLQYAWEFVKGKCNSIVSILTSQCLHTFFLKSKKSWALCCIRLLQSTFPLQSTVKNHTTTRILFVVWNKANKVSELWRHWEIINIVYTVADRQTCSLWLQSQQAVLPVAACLGWMEVWDPGGMVRLVQWVPFAQTLSLFSCCTVNLLWPLKQVDALSFFLIYILCTFIFFPFFFH